MRDDTTSDPHQPPPRDAPADPQAPPASPALPPGRDAPPPSPPRSGLTAFERLLGIAAVWVGCALAWVILGGTVVQRSGAEGRLGEEVHALWGAPQTQEPPRAHLRPARSGGVEEGVPRAPGSAAAVPAVAPLPSAAPAAPAAAVPGAAPGTVPVVEPPPAVAVPLVRSALEVALALEHRRRGLVWFPTYTVAFDAQYAFQLPAEHAGTLTVELDLERENALYDGLAVTRADGTPVALAIEQGVARWTEAVEAGARPEYRVRYRTRGTSTWTYALARGTGEVRDFSLRLSTDFPAVDFAPGSLAPVRHAATAGGWQGEWAFSHLVTGASVALVMPERLNPGPLAARITFFAPICLLFFFFVVALMADHRGHALHPMHWFFLGCAFFAFHLLFAYLVDHLDVGQSFLVAAAVSVLLVVTYARLFVGWRFALVEMGLAQVVYLVLFSWTFFFQGFTGLTVTVGAILTLALMMQLTGRRRWGHATPELASAAPPGCFVPYRCAAPPAPPAG